LSVTVTIVLFFPNDKWSIVIYKDDRSMTKWNNIRRTASKEQVE